MQLFYNTDVFQNKLNENEALHCNKVLRHKTGDKIFITDGNGKLYEAAITFAEKNICNYDEVKFVKEQTRKRKIHLAIAPTKNIDRVEWMLEKCTELGVAEFTFIETQRTERSKINAERLEKILAVAMKQSMNLFLPKLNEMMSYKKFMQQNFPVEMKKFICYVDENNPQTLFQSYNQSLNDVVILIGPEGDFTNEEVENAMEKGFEKVSLGNYRLRTETACMAAACILNI